MKEENQIIDLELDEDGVYSVEGKNKGITKGKSDTSYQKNMTEFLNGIREGVDLMCGVNDLIKKARGF